MSLYPISMNLVDITIKQLDVVNTHVDSDFREPISRKVEGASITLQGQINFGNKAFKNDSDERSGNNALTIGHVLFKKSVLDDQSIVLRKGDRVIAIASQATDLIIHEVRPESPLDGDFLLIYCELEEDKQKHSSIR